MHFILLLSRILIQLPIFLNSSSLVTILLFTRNDSSKPSKDSNVLVFLLVYYETPPILEYLLFIGDNTYSKLSNWILPLCINLLDSSSCSSPRC